MTTDTSSASDPSTKQAHAFQAEVAQLLHLVTHAGRCWIRRERSFRRSRPRAATLAILRPATIGRGM